MTNSHTSPGFLKTVLVLLRASQTRAAGRSRRQKQLLRSRAPDKAINWSTFGFVMAVLFFSILNIFAAVLLNMAVKSAQCVEVESNGKIVVSNLFLNTVKEKEKDHSIRSPSLDTVIDKKLYQREARRISERGGGSKEVIEEKLRKEIRLHGSRELVAWDEASPGLRAIGSESLPRMMGSLVLFLWILLLVFQGEGLELDIQRRKHPMWEWLFSHPAPPGAIFLAEMLTPIAANPIFWSAPLFVGISYNAVYGFESSIIAAMVIGIPMTVALACLGKAFEIGVMIRFAPRSRGAMIGLMSWVGFLSMILIFFMLLFRIKFPMIAKLLHPLTTLPWPWLHLFLGGRADGSFSFMTGLFTCLTGSVITIAGATWFSVWAAQKGLGGNTSNDASPSRSNKGNLRFGKDPLYRKELLWFIRDRGAIIQAILIPITIAAAQAFQFRFLLKHAHDSWNYLCGIAILFGTYFLWILGPRSLTSEGAALWISLTWPRGLESLLKAKAWLWSLISTVIVGLIMLYAAYAFPQSIWKIALVGIGWYLFSRSMAEKSVTLVTVTSSSGEQEKIPFGRRWATSLGMLTFSIGVITQQWHLAIIGIVFSYLTAAAMWQNFRARLPYLYDPWSEKIPPPPTLMHAMVAITIMVELTAVFSIPFAIFGPESILIGRAFSYTICSGFVAYGVGAFLNQRGVSLKDIFFWKIPAHRESGTRSSHFKISLSRLYKDILPGITGGLALGLFGLVYLTILQHFPETAEILEKSQAYLANNAHVRTAYAFIAIGVAPFAEEYLFRGLLYRALDREWGGWRAVIGSAAFFTIYHPPIAWIPVWLLGVSCALLYKKTGNLGTAVILHLVYNAIVVLI
jgi:membrane protease YdiL (CAAX protease family)